ncbi:MAG: hypothetical protein APR62_00600 [Smithella sp. SDB]|nr:MAG: hypothetical protein APR62_00600 [Smithella sp. SDB]
MRKSRDSRFLEKILTDAEIDFVNNTKRSDEALWSLWVSKETAYKVIKKTYPDTAFIPRQWQVVFNRFQSEYAEGKVEIAGKDEIFIRLFSNSDYIHCIGTDKPAILDKIIGQVEILPEQQDDPSLFVRLCLARKLAEHFSLNLNQITIKRIKEKGELQPPRVYIDGRKTDIDISLSHDGRFIAYAFSDYI